MQTPPHTTVLLRVQYTPAIGVARGAVGAPAPPGRGKNFRRNLQEKFASAPRAHQVHPQGEQESIFKTFFAEQGRFGGLFSRFRPSFEGDD